jgi:flagellar export protein FliJ
MSRKGLAVALRLARIEERRALALLGSARARSAALEDQLDALAAMRARARAGMALGAGESVAAEVLQQHCMQLAGAELLARSATAQLTAARSAEESARGALAQRRLRVRAVSNAIERRGRRERLHARRREAQRVDESVRALRARAEAGDVPA